MLDMHCQKQKDKLNGKYEKELSQRMDFCHYFIFLKI